MIRRKLSPIVSFRSHKTFFKLILPHLTLRCQVASTSCHPGCRLTYILSRYGDGEIVHGDAGDQGEHSAGVRQSSYIHSYLAVSLPIAIPVRSNSIPLVKLINMTSSAHSVVVQSTLNPRVLAIPKRNMAIRTWCPRRLC